MIFPAPSQLTLVPGRCILGRKARVNGNGFAAELLRPWLTRAITTAPEIGIETIELREDPNFPGLGTEGYALDCLPNVVRAVAKDQRGLRHAAQALRQLFSQFLHNIPAMQVVDVPRFSWRGVHLDSARHFQPVEDILRLLDLAALHRLSVLHWHLTDDQGWRMEIRKYPRLTEIGSIRPETKVGHHDDTAAGYDGTPYGGFYSQSDISRVVSHATRLGITVLPEIDLPGHMQAAICAYPFLGNGLTTPKMRTTWGVSTQILNCEPATLRFVEDILEEVLALFPSSLIHVGGDEVPIDEWRDSPIAQARAAALGFSKVELLQHHWSTHIAQWLAARGRGMIGWDEIFERSGPSLPKGTTVMAWRNEQEGVKAAMAGFDVVMTPNHPTYLDHYQVAHEQRASEPLAIGGACTLDHCAAWDPMPAALRDTPQAGRILGGQAQLWTEYMSSRDKIDYMAFPRLSLLAEALWSPWSARGNWQNRLRSHLDILGRCGVRYRPMM